MSLEAFHHSFLADIYTLIAERVHELEGSFPSEELTFAEQVMEHISEVGFCGEPTVCHWSGKVGNAKLRITGFAISDDETGLDLFITHYLGEENIQSVPDQIAQGVAKEALRFLHEVGLGKLEDKVDPTHHVRHMISKIHSSWNEFDRLRIFVITDGVVKTKRFVGHEVNGKLIAIEVMDIERLYRHTSEKPLDEVSVNFKSTTGRILPCVHVPDSDADYEYVLTAIPGLVLRDLYFTHGPRLLEANVRTFLGAKKKVNKGIIETLKNEPEHFLAYNNGLVIVCDEATFEKTDHSLIGLVSLKGLQIVNGGQTTSSIYFASRADKTIDLSHVMVPAKIIILKDDDQDLREKLTSRVSQFANSQNAIKMSDLSANRPFHVQLEKLANETWCPDGMTKWFYERSAGAYNVWLLREGNTPAKKKQLQLIVPPKRKLTKNDIAKYHEAWRGMPNQVALAGEKNFAAFMTALDEDPSLVPNPLNVNWYKKMIAKVILFKSIESLIKTKEAKETFRQGWVNIATYVVALVGVRFGEQLDLLQIWTEQDVSDGLKKLLLEWAIAVNEKFEQTAPRQQISEVAKRSRTWEVIRSMDLPMVIGAIKELKQAKPPL